MSNQQDEYNRARDARSSAEKAGVKGKDLEVLKAAEAAREAELRSAGGKPGGGILG
jgi:hypothetical protein